MNGTGGMVGYTCFSGAEDSSSMLEVTLLASSLGGPAVPIPLKFCGTLDALALLESTEVLRVASNGCLKTS